MGIICFRYRRLNSKMELKSALRKPFYVWHNATLRYILYACVAFESFHYMQFYIGAEDGWIYITIDRKKITKGVSHHEVFGADAVAKAVKKPFPGSVTAIYAHNAANIIVSGAKVLQCNALKS